ncbi:reverse transcriptase domain-containing protein [Tanacetum coccineum]
MEANTHSRSVMKNQWEDPKKKPTMSIEDIEEAVIEKTTMVVILEIGATINHETIIKTHNLVKKTLRLHQDLKINSTNPTLKKPFESSYEDEADEAKKKDESSSSKKDKSDPPPLKQRSPHLCLDGMPNYGKFLKDLVSNKSKMEQISVAFLNEECSAIVQNKLSPKLGDPGSFQILCTLANLVECLALADLGASINYMSYLLYASLSVNTLKPTRMSIRLANHDTHYPMDVIDDVTKEEFDALINDYEPFLSTLEKINETFLDKEFKEFMAVAADAIIRVKNKELNLGVEDDKITFLINKAMQHSHSNDDTFFRIDVIDEVTEEELDALSLILIRS